MSTDSVIISETIIQILNESVAFKVATAIIIIIIIVLLYATIPCEV